ncbi:MAG TPA: hypothetical protein VE567_08610, partial [Sphingomonas sp.]|nr:hypothetical protein [Sphingomonas sp.]
MLLPCLALTVSNLSVRAQIVTPDLFSPVRTSEIATPDSPLRRTAAEAADPLNDPRLQRDKERESRAPSR